VIKRIELINFMSHQHTVIRPADGLTVLVGPNNCGKSAVVTALQILANNDSSTFVLRHGEKECKIIVETDDGHVIEWSRGKNKSPKYVVDGQVFDRLKQSVPPQVSELLKLPRVANVDGKTAFDIHFGLQKEPVFLVKDSKRAAAEFFSSSSDAGHLMEMQALHRQKVKRQKQEQSRLRTESNALESEIKLLDPLALLLKRFEKSGRLESELLAKEEKAKHLKGVIEQMKRERHEQTVYAAKVKILKRLNPQPTYKPTENLKQLISDLQKQARKSVVLKRTVETLSELRPVPKISPTNELKNTIAELKKVSREYERTTRVAKLLKPMAEPPQPKDTSELKELLTQMKRETDTIDKCRAATKSIEKQFDEFHTEIDGWLEYNPLCPTCGGVTDVDHLLCQAPSVSSDDDLGGGES